MYALVLPSRDEATRARASYAAQYSRHTVNVHLFAEGKLRNTVGTESGRK
jgi:hypothetical protein